MARAGFKLVDGNEQISALFQKTKNIELCGEDSEVSKIRNYIYLTEIYRRTYIGKCIIILKRSIVWMLRYMRSLDKRTPFN